MSRIASPTPADARMRLPREPFPGLRPFLDFEAALFFGRERQVREIIERLAATQFVAVLGGSGSGKSSLIHAGVTPALRSFGIRGAGDLWLPMSCTPGTNVEGSAEKARAFSPVMRLARRFAALLRSRGSEAADRARVDDIAAAFRQDAGFARLLEAYADELDIAPGPDRKDARVLFVLDQFEEVFHPTNKDVPDARVLVERVLDHFFSPHPRCHVVLTMRSEHLNDCATFLELPDAINKSSFLVRRLDGDELREAIVGPVNRYLRLVARSAPDTPLPEQVAFEPAVIDRLLRDVQRITHDPDHLPLLQHLLARLWQSALEREEMDRPVPETITALDLARAVLGGKPGDDETLEPEANTLRDCLNNWPERLYQWHDEAQRRQLDEVFRHLAFKDPNTGLYSQQRIDVDDCARIVGEGMTRDTLRALMSEGFLGSVDYLFWDDHEPERVTLKVSHESFIRGWQRFRRLIDAESQRYAQFAELLRRAADWQDNARSEDFLLEAGALRRLRDNELERRLAHGQARAASLPAAWLRLLSLDRDAARLQAAVPVLAGFVEHSGRRLKERERREQFLRRTTIWVSALTAFFGLIPLALFTVFVQTPALVRIEWAFDAANRANATLVQRPQAGFAEAEAALNNLAWSAERADRARSGAGSGSARAPEWVTSLFERLAPVRRQDGVLTAALAQSEPLVNQRLGEQLRGAVWRVAAAADGAAPLPAPTAQEATCALTAADAAVADGLRGRLHVAAAEPGDSEHGTRRALLVADADGDQRRLRLYSATWHPARALCVLGPAVLVWPEALDARAVFDASLRLVAFGVSRPGMPTPPLIVHQLGWTLAADGTVVEMRLLPVAVVAEPGLAEAVRAAAGAERAQPVPTWPAAGGVAIAVGEQHWRVIWQEAQPLAIERNQAALEWLQPAPAESSCRALAAGLVPSRGFVASMLQGREHCLLLQRGALEADAAPVRGAPAREELRVALYRRPTEAERARVAQSPPPPLASVLPYARLAVGSVPVPARWALAHGGAHDGWLLLEGGATTPLLGLPLANCALWRLAGDLGVAREPPPEPDVCLPR